MSKASKQANTLWQSWVTAILWVIAIAILVIQITNPLSAPDLWWHMAIGRHILDTGSLILDHSVFTWMPAIEHSTYNSWLADIILYLTYDHFGAIGLISLRFTIFFLLFFLACRYAITRGVARNPITWAVVLVALTTVWPAYLIKPELFTIGLFSIVVWLFFHMRHKGETAWWYTYFLPVILIIWVNVHGAFFISSLFFAAATIGEIMNGVFCPSQAMPHKLRKHFFAAMVLCFVAILINPYGYELPLTIIREILSQEGLNTYIVSYKPTYEFNAPPLYILDYMFMTMILFILLIWQKLKNRETDWVVILSFIGYSAIFTQVARVTFFLGPVFLFASLDLLAKKENSWFWPSSKVIKILLAALSISITTLIGWRTIDDHRCKLLGSKNSIQQLFSVSSSFPISETDYIRKNLKGSRIGNMYRDGGYLIYHTWPDKLVSIDPRYFPFKDWIDEYAAFANGKNISQFTKKYLADYWLINYNDLPAFQWFAQSNMWKPILFGTAGAIFVPSNNINDEEIISTETTRLMQFGDMSAAFMAAIQLNDLSFANHILDIAQNTLEYGCDKHIVLVREMKDTLAGLQAYNEGNYAVAASILGGKTWNFTALMKATSALVILAENSWDLGDISSARNWYMKAFKVQSTKTITDIYNFTVLDWRYRHSVNAELQNKNNELHWRELVDFILRHEEKIHPRKYFIVETAKAMKEDRYDGSARLILRDGSLSTFNHKLNKIQNGD